MTFAEDVRRPFHQLSVGGHGIAAGSWTGGREGSLTVGSPEIAMTVCASCAKLESFAELLAQISEAVR